MAPHGWQKVRDVFTSAKSHQTIHIEGESSVSLLRRRSLIIDNQTAPHLSGSAMRTHVEPCATPFRKRALFDVNCWAFAAS